MDHAANITWDINPEVFSWGIISVRWYGLFFALSFLLGFHIVQWIFRKEGRPEQGLERLLIYAMTGTIVGARFGHCLFYEPAYYLANPIEIIKFWHGGLASHGGAIGMVLSVYLYTRTQPDQTFLWLMDRIAIPAALGGAFIRLGNLFNSEIIGTPSAVPWAFVFARIDPDPRHPAQLYESIAYGIIFLFILYIYRKRLDFTPAGLILGLYFVSVFGSRFLIEFVKERQAAFGHELSLSMGQWLSLPMIFVGAFLLWRTRVNPQAD